MIMTKKELRATFKKLETEKYSLFQQGFCFDFIVKDNKNKTIIHTGVGLSTDVAEMILAGLCDLYKGTEGATLEEFAESVKESLIEFYKDYGNKKENGVTDDTTGETDE